MCPVPWYAYPFTFARRAVVATMDLSASNLHMLRTDHWLADPRNVVQVWLRFPSWQKDGLTTKAPQEDRPQNLRMAEWSVEELAARVAREDCEGLARQLRANSVNGADFQGLSEEGSHLWM